jgi:MFS family permease
LVGQKAPPRLKEIWHAAIPMIITGLVLIGLPQIPDRLFTIQIVLIMAVGFMLKMPTPLISSYLTEILPLNKAIPAVGVVIGGGSFMGQFLGPLLVGTMKSIATGYGPSFAALGVAGMLGVAGIFGGTLLILAGMKDKKFLLKPA